MLTTAIMFILVADAVAEIPPYIHVCGRRNPNLDTCIKQNAMKLKEKLAEGMPEIKVPSMEPVIVDHILLSNSDSFKATMININLYGLTQFQMPYVRMDFDKQQLDMDLHFKHIRVNTELKIAATILFPMAGEGTLTGYSDDMLAHVSLHYQFKNYNGKKHIYFSKMTTKLTFKDYHSHFVAEDDKESPLAAGINAALENSQPEIIKESTPQMEASISRIALELVNKVCKHISFDELFPDRE